MKAAQDAAYWARAAFWTGVSGTLGLILTLIFTALATRAAQRSAKAAERAIDGNDAALGHSQAVSERDLRAYVFLDRATILDGSLADSPVPELINWAGAVAEIKNTGKTPAYRVVSWLDVAVVDFRNENQLVSPPVSLTSASTIPPGNGIVKNRRIGRALTTAEIEGINAGTHALYMWGRVEYVDAFGKERFSNFRMKHIGIWPPNKASIFLFCDSGNESESDPT